MSFLGVRRYKETTKYSKGAAIAATYGGNKTMDEMNTNINVDNAAEQQAATDEVKTYTQEEVLKLLQQESDRRVSQALAKQAKKHEKEMSLSRLDDDAREKALKDSRIAELEEQLAAFQTEKNRSELKSVLSSRGLSAEFADIIAIGEDIEAAQANIDKLDKLFKIAVRTEVEKRLAGTTPKGNGGNSTTEYTKESKGKLSLKEINDLATSQPELFAKLF